MISFAAARRMMVDGQIRTNDVTDPRILDAFGAVPREEFVPSDQAQLAYLDRDVPVAGEGEGRRYLLKPMVLAKLIHAADVDPADRVLVIGAATGYSAAIVARLAANVVALEEDAVLAAGAERRLAERGAANAKVVRGPLNAGAASDGPYDVVLIDGAVEAVPDAVGRQLRENGRLVCVVRNGVVGKAMLYICDRGDLSGRPLFDAAAPDLPGFARAKEFSF